MSCPVSGRSSSGFVRWGNTDSKPDTVRPASARCRPRAARKIESPSGNSLNLEVHTSIFSLLGSCSSSEFGSAFGVRSSGFGVRGSAPNPTRNRTPNSEPEHDLRSENQEVRTVLISDRVVAVDVRLGAVGVGGPALAALAARGLVIAAVVLRLDAFALELLIAIVRRADLFALRVAVGRRNLLTVQLVAVGATS